MNKNLSLRSSFRIKIATWLLAPLPPLHDGRFSPLKAPEPVPPSPLCQPCWGPPRGTKHTSLCSQPTAPSCSLRLGEENPLVCMRHFGLCCSWWLCCFFLHEKRKLTFVPPNQSLLHLEPMGGLPQLTPEDWLMFIRS